MRRQLGQPQTPQRGGPGRARRGPRKGPRNCLEQPRQDRQKQVWSRRHAQVAEPRKHSGVLHSFGLQLQTATPDARIRQLTDRRYHRPDHLKRGWLSRRISDRSGIAQPCVADSSALTGAAVAPLRSFVPPGDGKAPKVLESAMSRRPFPDLSAIQPDRPPCLR